MATIIAIVIAVMVDRYLPLLPGAQMLNRMRSTGWVNAYLAKCISLLEKLSIKQAYLIILSAILPISIALFLVKLILGMLLGGLGNLLFVVVTLFYFLGYRPKTDTEASSVFVTAHETSFGVLFWFAVFGPTGAFIYWFLVVSKQSPVILDAINDNLRKGFIWVHAMAAWVPARISGFIYALVGNFDPGFKCWMVCIREPKLSSSQVLQDCGQAALSTNNPGEEQRLVARAFAAWVVLIVIKGLI